MESIQNMTIKEKLQVIGAKIQKMKIEKKMAEASGDYELYRLKRGAIEIAQKEFLRLSKLYVKGKTYEN